MAGLSTSLSIQIKMTNLFNRQEAAASKLINRMEKLDTVLKKVGSDGTGGMSRMLRSQTLLEKSQRGIYELWLKIGSGAKMVAQHTGDYFKSSLLEAKNGAGSMAGLWSKMGGQVKAAFSKANIKGFFDEVQKLLASFNNRNKYEVQLSTVMANQGSTPEQVGGVVVAADALAKTTTYSANGLIGGAAELSAYLQDAEALEAMLPTLANYAAGMGGMEVTTEQMVAYATDLGKAMGGSFDGLLEKGFVLTDAQKEMMAMGSGMERVAAITDVINQSWGGLAEAFAQTPEGKIQQFTNTMDSLAASVGSSVVSAFLTLLETVMAFVESEAGQWLIEGATLGINLIIMAMTWLVSVVQWLASTIQQNWALIQPILLAIIAVLLPYMLAQLWAMVAPVLAQAGAWIVANAPLLLMIGLVALLMYLMSGLGLTFEDVCGFIGAILGGLYAFCYNLIADIWNFIAVFAEFFGNVFNDPIGAIMRLFIGLADGILGFAQTIADALDWLFGSNMAGGIQSLRDSMSSWADEKLGEQKFTVERMEKITAADVAADWGQKGTQLGAGIKDGLGGLASGFGTSGMMDGVGGLGAGGTEIPDVGSVGEVGRIKDEVDISKEDLELLRDIAEARFVQNFVTLTPQVSLRVDTVNENADINLLAAAMEEKLEEEFVAVAEGVYN